MSLKSEPASEMLHITSSRRWRKARSRTRSRASCRRGVAAEGPAVRQWLQVRGLANGHVEDRVASQRVRSPPRPQNHQLSERDQIAVFETPGLHCRSPDSGALRYKFRGSKKRIWSNAGGWWKARNFLLQLLHRNVKRFRGGLVFKAHRLLYHSTLGLRVIKKKRRTFLSWSIMRMSLPREGRASLTHCEDFYVKAKARIWP